MLFLALFQTMIRLNKIKIYSIRKIYHITQHKKIKNTLLYLKICTRLGFHGTGKITNEYNKLTNLTCIHRFRLIPPTDM